MYIEPILPLSGLMISGCAVAARVLGNKDYTKMAENSARFVLSKLYNPDKQILMRNAYRDADGCDSIQYLHIYVSCVMSVTSPCSDV